MARVILNRGSSPGDATADSIFTGVGQINDMFGEIYGSRAVSVTDFGDTVGTGDAAVDTQAFIDAAAAADSVGENNVVAVPGGKDYYINQTITWPPGVHMIGGAGSATNQQIPPAIRWSGTAGGTMFTSQTPGDRVFNMNIHQIYFRAGGTTPGTAWELGSTGGNGIDFNTEFTRCWFANFSGDAIKYLHGPTNLHLRDCRWDAVAGYAIYIRVSNQSIFSLDRFTLDIGVGSGKGLLHLDGAGTGSNQYIIAHVANGRLEINSTPLDQKAMFLFTLDSTASQGQQHFFTGHNLWFTNGPGITDWACFKPVRTPAGDTTDLISITVLGLYKGDGRLIDNTITAVPSFAGQLLPIWQFAPLGYGSSAIAALSFMNTFIAQTLVRDLLVGPTGPSGLMSNGRGCIHMANAITVPSTNPTAGGCLYVDAGALKYRGSSGTVTNLGNA